MNARLAPAPDARASGAQRIDWTSLDETSRERALARPRRVRDPADIAAVRTILAEGDEPHGGRQIERVQTGQYL